MPVLHILALDRGVAARHNDSGVPCAPHEMGVPHFCNEEETASWCDQYLDCSGKPITAEPSIETAMVCARCSPSPAVPGDKSNCRYDHQDEFATIHIAENPYEEFRDREKQKRPKRGAARLPLSSYKSGRLAPAAFVEGRPRPSSCPGQSRRVRLFGATGEECCS